MEIDTSAEILKLYTKTYYIAPSQSDSSLNALWQLICTPVSCSSEELIEGVEDLQILYGLDTDNDGTINRYVNASSTLDWSSVVAVKTSMLVATLDDYISSVPFTGSFTNTSTTANDSRLRREFTATVKIRNTNIND